MFNNAPSTMNEAPVNYPITDDSLPFADYIQKTRAIIHERRPDLPLPAINTEQIIQINQPYELWPEKPVMSGNKPKTGVLLIHGLLDSPFTLKDIGMQLQASGVLCRAILLPGHGTTPDDLHTISWHDWVRAVRYGIASLRKETEQVYLIGFSTGAALSIYEALQDSQLSGILLLAPAIQVRAPIDLAIYWHNLKKWLRHKTTPWLYVEKELDYAKYSSIAHNAATQVGLLIREIKNLRRLHALDCPVFMGLSHEDETISSHRAIDFFSRLPKPNNRMVLYAAHHHDNLDPRILIRNSRYPKLHIQHLSHMSIPFAPDNPHYGQQGDYPFAARRDVKHVCYGAWHRPAIQGYNLLYKMGILKNRRCELTYNPDFPFLVKQIKSFINPSRCKMREGIA